MKIYKDENGKLIIDGQNRTKITYKESEIKSECIQDEFLKGINLPYENIEITNFHIKVEND